MPVRPPAAPGVPLPARVSAWFRRWGPILPLLFAEGIVWAGFGALLPIMPLYFTDHGTDLPTLGLIIAAWPAVRIVTEPVFGWLADRVPRIPLMVVRIPMDALEAIRRRRSVRQFTDRPVSDEDLDELLRLALLAPTGGMQQAWSLLVVRDAQKRARLAELVMRGGAEYFRIARPPAEGASDEDHAAWARGYAETALGTYPMVPVWVLCLRVPRNAYPAVDDRDFERDADITSVAFMLENLMVAARAKGLGTVPTVFQWFVEDEVRALFGLPDEVEVPLLTPLGHPVQFPEGLPPALAKIRRPWRTLVHDDAWGATRA